MPPVPVMVLRIGVLSLSSKYSARLDRRGPQPRDGPQRALPRLALRQLGPRRLERLARDLVGGPGPGRRVRRLVAHEAAVALAVEQREDLLERHAAPPGRQAVERLARLEPGARHVAVLEIRDLAERDVVDRLQAGAAALQVIGVEQEPAARVRGLR